MLSENIILQSAGSLSVAVMALLMLVLQTLFFFRKPQFTWYAWSAAIAFSALLYSVGIFLEYNTPAGPLNRFSGLLEWTAIICLVHCLYGFTFSYLGIESTRYHPIAGVCHGLILILLWSTNYVVSENFTTRDFIGLGTPYIEPALGPLGPVFMLYAAIAGMIAMAFWIKHKRTDPKHRIIFLLGMGFWLLLGIHDGLASLGLPTLQYFMEYGFLGFAMVVLWVVFHSYLEIAAEEKYRVITEFANDGIMVVQDGKMVFRNPASCDLIGVPLTDSDPRDFLDIMVSEDRKTVLKHYRTLLEGGHVPNPHTVRIRIGDGEQRFVEIVSSLIQYRNRPAVLAIMRDMTERKQAEEALRESEDKFKTLFEFAPDAYYLNDLEGYFIDGNKKAEELIGYRREELVGKNFIELDLLPPEQVPKAAENLKKNIEGQTTGPGELILNRKDGSQIPVEIRTLMTQMKGQSVVLGIARDITSRKQAEEALQKAHDELESRVAERTGELQMRTHELDERVKELNCFYGISQLLEEPHISLEKTLQGIVDLIPSSWQYPENTCVRLTFNGQELKTKNFKESSWKQSADIKMHDDRIGTVEVFYIKEKQEMYEGPFIEQERTLINAIAERLGNILVRFQAEETLMIRDKAIASSINGMAISDAEWNLTYVNEASLKMWGYDETEVLGKPVVDFWLRKKEAVKAMKILLDKGTWTGELIAKRKDGSLFDAQVFTRLITDNKGKNVCVVSSFIDVTKEKILQDELIRSERLAASGGLAASIAHEINSPLQGIRSIISLIERTYKQDEGISENLNLIKGGFASIRDIVKRLLDLNRPGKEKKQPMNVNSVIEDTVSLLSSYLKKNRVKVNLSLSSNVPGITASPQQLGQVFLNMINNSVEAMAGISKPGDRKSTGREIIINSNLKGKNIVIEVADTGPGIPKKAMVNIFDPFYTIKKKMGMGIGLSICHGIMEDHNGSIAAKNSPEGGAVFTITLPAR